jgi:hypothetical protein
MQQQRRKAFLEAINTINPNESGDEEVRQYSLKKLGFIYKHWALILTLLFSVLCGK